ncbi:hypothetical protein M407DRAFT_32207 [Tulasnella calospora MUT 4182]|uniref:Uncharacterized protein n=1 Tax=Tulasnella calospora MUT 4182 TaxID=1051891 RepID=A0A0C3L9C0_9AGAM|nr:hypothetical protein M407DRAFT_32207 [Tulasnella calospora MUT 4182]
MSLVALCVPFYSSSSRRLELGLEYDVILAAGRQQTWKRSLWTARLEPLRCLQWSALLNEQPRLWFVFDCIYRQMAVSVHQQQLKPTVSQAEYDIRDVTPFSVGRGRMTGSSIAALAVAWHRRWLDSLSLFLDERTARDGLEGGGAWED